MQPTDHPRHVSLAAVVNRVNRTSITPDRQDGTSSLFRSMATYHRKHAKDPDATWANEVLAKAYQALTKVDDEDQLKDTLIDLAAVAVHWHSKIRGRSASHYGVISSK